MKFMRMSMPLNQTDLKTFLTLYKRYFLTEGRKTYSENEWISLQNTLKQLTDSQKNVGLNQQLKNIVKLLYMYVHTSTLDYKASEYYLVLYSNRVMSKGSESDLPKGISKEVDDNISWKSCRILAHWFEMQAWQYIDDNKWQNNERYSPIEGSKVCLPVCFTCEWGAYSTCRRPCTTGLRGKKNDSLLTLYMEHQFWCLSNISEGGIIIYLGQSGQLRQI